MRVYDRVGLDHRTLSYDDFVCLWLNVEPATGAENFNNAVSTAVATGKSRMPKSWITAAVRGKSGESQWQNWDVMRQLGE